METDSNIHAGHRERLNQKLLSNCSVLNDHELLEALLFCAIPRVDTNPLAHKLIKEFGSVQNVFNADTKQLVRVDGVGKKTASLIVCVGEIYRRIKETSSEKVVMYTLSDVKKNLLEYYKNAIVEKFVVSFLNKRYEVIKNVEFCDYQQSMVGTDIKKLSEEISIHKPTYVVLSHNHVSGDVIPSSEDISSTRRILVICDLYGVKLIDHVIVSKDKTYSFYSEGLLDDLKKQTDIDKVFETLKEI